MSSRLGTTRCLRRRFGRAAGALLVAATAGQALVPAAAATTGSGAVYGVPAAPEIVWVTAPDGAQMYVQLWRPTRGENGSEPPARVPVVLTMSPYRGLPDVEMLGAVGLKPPYAEWRDQFVPRGYAYALGHVYGTGSSEGCLETFGPKEIAATSAVVEALASAGWSTGRVGMIGTSYDGSHALFTAARGSDAAREHLAAVVAHSAPTSFYDLWGHDGVPGAHDAASLTAGYAAFGQLPPEAVSEQPDPVRTVHRQAGTCRAENLAAAAEFLRTGSYLPWHAARSTRADAPEVRAATLMFDGLHDLPARGALKLVGFFDRIPARTRHNLVLGQWGHAKDYVHLADQKEMVNGWFDRHLGGDANVSQGWPRVQVQDSTGAWRAEDGWPDTGGPAGQLALSRSIAGIGELGSGRPTVPTTYLEPATALTPAGRATFSTGPLEGPLHLTGQPVLDLWLELQRDDAHVAVQLRAFDRPGGKSLVASDNAEVMESQRHMILGYRSARHLDPIRAGEFRQMADGRPAVGVPVRVPVRFMIPLDVVVPAGGEVTIEVAGTNTMGQPDSSLGPFPSQPSGSDGTVRILHDCEHPSALRFLMPDGKPEALDVEMTDVSFPQLAPVGEIEPGLRDGGGLASQDICGVKPRDPARVLEDD